MSLADQSQQWFPTSVQVTVLQARSLRIKGKNGTNDAYAIMQVAKDKFSTSVVEKCVAPVWEEEATFDLPLFHQDATERSTLHVYVMHRALVGPDKVLGQAVINLPELYENKARDKTEWFKLLNKTGKVDKDRGEVLLDIQFMKNNMTASMFDLSSQGKPRSRIGKLKDKLRGKKKEGLSDSASAIVPASQGMMDSEGEEEEAPAEVAVPAKAKKNALKSLFVTQSNLQRNTSQSMSTLSSLPERDSALSSSVGSGLNLEAPEGKKKKFKFLTHKRTGSSDGNPTQSAAGPHPPVTICINGSHVYSEESEPRSLTSSSGSTEDLHRMQGRRGSGAGVDPNPFTHRGQAEEQREREEKERVRRAQEERDQMEEERRRKVAEEEERQKEERKRKEEEQRKKIEEEKEKIRIDKEKEEKRRKIEEEKEKIRIEKEKEEKRRKIEEEEKEKMRIEKEQRRKAEEEEKERKRLEQEEKRKIAEEKKKREEERMKMEEEERKSAEEERERARLREEECIRVERKRKEDEERMKKEQEEEQKRLEAERLRKEEQRKTEMERRLTEEKKAKEVEEKEKQKREEEKRAREEEERMKVERKRREEEDKRIHEERGKANERLRLEEERMQKERQTKDEQKLAELKKLEERERESKEGSEAEQESRPVPWTRAGNVGSGVRAGGPHMQNPFEPTTSSTNPFEDNVPSTNPFEDALSLEAPSANLFEGPPTTSQSAGLARSARVTAVKPSTSVSGLVSQMSVAHTNPFMDDYSSGNPSSADGGTGRTPKKGPAPLPPQNKTQVLTPAAPSRPFSSTLLEETNPHSSCGEVSKCQAPLPPDRKKNTREEAAEDSMVHCTIAPSDVKNTLEVPEKHHPVEVASVSEDVLKLCPMETQQGQRIIKMDPDSNQGNKQTTYIQVSAEHTISISGQRLISKIQANAEPFSCVGPGATKHNKGPAPARPSAACAPNRKSGSEDEPSHHSASQTMDTLHHEKQTSASLNFDRNESPSNQKPLGVESFAVANDTKAKFVLHAGELSSDVSAIENVQRDLGKHLPEIKGEEEHLEKMVAPDAINFSAPSHVDQRLHPESRVCETDRLPDMESVSSDGDALTGASKKKSRAPVPPVKPKRVRDTGLLSQQSALPVTLNEDDCSSGLGSFSSKTGQDKAQDPREGVASSAPTPAPTPASTGSPLPADMSPVVKPCVALSAGRRSGSVPRPVPWARVLSADGQAEHSPCGGGGGGAGTAAASAIRPHAVKPLNAADRQPDHREADEPQAAGSADLSQPKKAVEAAGPYAQLTHGELAAIVACQQEQLSRRDARIQELEQYIDNLLLRVMEEKPSILMAMASQKKAV